MDSFQNFVNLNLNSILPQPKKRKSSTFPLENVEEDIMDIYSKLYALQTKIQTAKQNPANDTESRSKCLDMIGYKIKSCSSMIKQINHQLQKL